jgi:septum formation protein
MSTRRPHTALSPEDSTHRRAFPRVHLASSSPRRRELLTSAGVPHDAAHPGIDDAQLPRGLSNTVARRVRPSEWVAALAYMKASSAVRSGLVTPGAEVVLGADTVVVVDDLVMSSPEDAGDARRMLRLMRSRGHEVLTGVVILDQRVGTRELMVDRARVQLGDVSGSDIDEYVSTGAWRGKAGAYNLSERLAAGWPVEFSGDPGTIMGLPMRRLVPRLGQLA